MCWRFFCSSLMFLFFFLRLVFVVSNVRGLFGWFSELNFVMLDLVCGLFFFVVVLVGFVIVEFGGIFVVFFKFFSSLVFWRFGDFVFLELDWVECFCGDLDIKDVLVLVWIWFDMLVLWIFDCFDFDNCCRVVIVMYLCLVVMVLKYVFLFCISWLVYRIRYIVIFFILI